MIGEAQHLHAVHQVDLHFFGAFSVLIPESTCRNQHGATEETAGPVGQGVKLVQGFGGPGAATGWFPVPGSMPCRENVTRTHTKKGGCEQIATPFVYLVGTRGFEPPTP